MNFNEYINRIIDKMESLHLLIIILAIIGFNILKMFRSDYKYSSLLNTVGTFIVTVNTTLNNINNNNININSNINRLISMLENFININIKRSRR